MWWNISLGFLNWVVFPIKMVLFLLISILTRIIEPYSVPKVPAVNQYWMDTLARQIEDRLINFSYFGFILCELRGRRPYGRNHYTGDWCLWEGVRIAMLAWKYRYSIQHYSISVGNEALEDLSIAVTSYLENWIDNDGYVWRGWKWINGERVYEGNLTIDQLSGLVFGLSQCPMMVLIQNRSRIRTLVDTFIKNNYRFKDPDLGYAACRDLRPGIQAVGVHMAIAMSLFLIAYRATGNMRYRKYYKRLVRRGGLLMCAVPLGKVFEYGHGYNTNISIMSLCALCSLRKSRLIDFGIKFCWWINRRVYNPWWSLLADCFVGIPEKDRKINLYMLSTMDKKNFKDHEIHQDELLRLNNTPIPWKRYFRFFGTKVPVFPPPLKYKGGDCFMLQSVWRDAYGLKNDLLKSNKQYNMLTYLAPYYLYKLRG